MKKTTKKKTTKKKSKKYFTEVHERAIIDFVEEEDFKKREVIYRTLIYPVFKEMIEKIIYTYRYTTIPNTESLKDECQAFLITVLNKYKRPKGKAFSYFSVVTKNWFIHKKKKLAMRKELNFEDISQVSNDERLLTDFSYEDKIEEVEFWLALRNEMDKWDESTLKLSENELLVISAIKTLFDNLDDLEIITRKSIYLYLREITGLPTKKIVIVLTRVRKKYLLFKKRWHTEIF